MSLTYWVQWFRDGDRNETQHTTNTSITVDGFSPGSSYEFSVWAEREGVNSYKETLNAATGKSNHFYAPSSLPRQVFWAPVIPTTPTGSHGLRRTLCCWDPEHFRYQNHTEGTGSRESVHPHHLGREEQNQRLSQYPH
jgi:hypothetical protein